MNTRVVQHSGLMSTVVIALITQAPKTQSVVCPVALLDAGANGIQFNGESIQFLSGSYLAFNYLVKALHFLPPFLPWLFTSDMVNFKTTV
ncbi:hypothetical protein CR513_50686, partial [Mucuna pruriens]